MTDNKCKAITEIGLQCTREGKIDGYCTQHYNKVESERYKIYEESERYKIYEESEQSQALPKELMSHILSDYIEYNELKKLENNIQNLKINPNRISTQRIDNESTYTINTLIDNIIVKSELYRTNGILIFKQIYHNKDKSSVTIYDYYLDGTIKNHYDRINGIKNGIEKKYRPNGVLQFVVNYKDGYKNGTFLSFYEDGKTIREKRNYIYCRGNWPPEKLDETQYTYWPNGAIRKKQIYAIGKIHEEIKYNKDEKIKFHFLYK
jgi:antitoxin component YwqK of YwqJK toxin-antitoxin module